MDIRKKYKLPFIPGADIKDSRRAKMHLRFQNIVKELDAVTDKLHEPHKFCGKEYTGLVSTFHCLNLEYENLEKDICREFAALDAEEAIKKYERQMMKKAKGKSGKKKKGKKKRKGGKGGIAALRR